MSSTQPQAIVPTGSRRADALSGRDTRVQTYVKVQTYAVVCGRMRWGREGPTGKEGARDLGTSLVVKNPPTSVGERG